MSYIWNTLFKAPINLSLVFLYHLFFQNLGVAIIVLTILIQLILAPLRLPSMRTSKKLRDLKPHLDDLKHKHKDDQAAFVKAQMEFYKKHGINPLGGILPTLVSIPVIIALYQVLLGALKSGSALQVGFLWLDLAKPDRFFILPILVALSQWFSTKMIAPVKSGNAAVSKEKNNSQGKSSLEDSMEAMQSQMKYIFPLFSGFIVATLPSGVGLYWFTSLIFSIIQQKLVH